jgi:hypothetical protein
MRAYDIARFVHFVGLSALFGAFAIYLRAGIRLRAAETMEQVHAALGLLESTRPMFPAAWVMLLASGIYMVATRWQSLQSWIAAGLVGIVALWGFGAGIGGRHLGAIRAAASDARGPVPGTVSRLIGRPLPWTVMTALNTTALGIMFVMTTKPGWAASFGIVAAAALLGAGVGARLVRAPSTRQP